MTRLTQMQADEGDNIIAEVVQSEAETIRMPAATNVGHKRSRNERSDGTKKKSNKLNLKMSPPRQTIATTMRAEFGTTMTRPWTKR